jgi:glycerophosphoryl diester phosphodiesterase
MLVELPRLGRPPHRPHVMAHRGAMALAPENTLASFELGIASGAEILETDLWFTRDGQLVCHHDGTAERMTGDPRAISDMTLAEVRTLTVHDGGTGYAGERIPTLDELLALAPPGLILALELKDPAFAFMDAARLLADRIADRVAANTVLTVTFHLERLEAMQRVEPRMATGFITPFDVNPDKPVTMLGCYYPVLLLNPLYVCMAHYLGRWVCVLDDRVDDHLQAYLRFGVDAVLSDNPARTIALLDRLT